MMLYKKYINYFILLLSLYSCSTSTTTPDPAAPNESNVFYPQTGTFIIYEVSQTQYSLVSQPIVSSFQLKESVKGTFQDAQGQESLRIERYRRETENQAWKLDSVFTAKRQIDKALKTESNQTYIKLVFPLKDNLKWDGNALNAQGKDDYELRKVNQNYQIGSKIYPNSVTVIQQNDSTLVSQDKRIEVYAVNIGLIYKEKTNLAFCSNPTCLGKAQIDFGTRTFLKINSYGKE
jgi:hypothetical protein